MTTATTTRRSRRPRLLRQARVWYRRRHRPRAWWQKALRVAVFAVVLAGGAYVTMPWWLPTRWLGDLIAADLADKTGLDVQIGRVSVSWSGGVELYGFQIDAPPDFGGEVMLTIQRVRADFSPLTFLASKRIAWLQLDQPTLHLAVDEAGNANVDALRGLLAGPQPERIIVHRAAISVSLPHHSDQLHLTVNDMQFKAGRLQQFGSVVVAASLQQGDENAPMSLHVESGNGNQQVAARAQFHFSNVDLAQLSLPAFLPLPLNELAGRASGAIEVRINREGMVDRFQLDLSVDDLAIDPSGGPAWPVIAEAHLRVEGVYDPLQANGRLEIHSLTVRLPEALELTGDAVVFTDALVGNWEAIESVHLDGRIYPARLAAMARPRSDMPDSDLGVDGPVRLTVEMTHRGPTCIVAASLDATDAVVRQADHILKPAGRRLKLAVRGRVDDRNWTCRIDESRLVLGDNELTGAGTVRHLNRRLKHWLDGRQPTGRAILDDLANVSWEGAWRIGDLAALAQLWPDRPAYLADIQQAGSISGAWSIGAGPGHGLTASIHIPSRTTLAVSPQVVKLAGQAVDVQLTANIDADSAAVRDVELELSSGAGRVQLSQGLVTFSDKDAAVATWRMEASHVQDLLACLSGLSTFGEIRGGLRGRGEIRIGSDAATLAAELSNIHLARFRPFGPDPDTPTSRLEGRLTVTARTQRVSDDLKLTFELGGDELAWQQTAPNGLRKPLGRPLRVALAATIPQTGQARVDHFSIDLIDAALEITHVAPIGLDVIEGSFRVAATMGPGLAELVPALSDLVDEFNARGPVTLTGRFKRDRSAVDISASADASALSVGPIGKFVKPVGLLARMHMRVHGPADLSTFTIDLSEGRLGGLAVSGRATVDRVKSIAEGVLSLRADHAGALVALAPALQPFAVAGGFHVDTRWQVDEDNISAVSQFGADNLALTHNDLTLALSGGGAIETAFHRRNKTLTLAAIRLDGLRFELGRTRGWLVTDLTGPTVSVAAPTSPATSQPKPIEPLAFGGEVHLIAERIDAHQLSQWLDPKPWMVIPPELVFLRDSGSLVPKLSPEEIADLHEQAQVKLEQLLPHMRAGNVTLRATIDHMRSYNPLIARVFNLRNMRVTGSLADGQFRLAYTAGLNSGTLQRWYEIDWTQPAPLLRYGSEIRNARAEANIQPLLEWEFPGNIVTGFFSHREDFTTPLVNGIAHSLHPRHPLHPTGTAKTVAIDGSAEGQAAPKIVTKLFPGLNTAKYRYERMTAFETHKPNGEVYSDMVFTGPSYDTYMEGTTDIHHIGRYEIGVILLASPQSHEWNHAYRVGRIPILKFEGRIDDGRMFDVSVSYPLPTQAAYAIFLKNNLLYRIWLVNKQRRRQEAIDAGRPAPREEP